MSKIFITGGAGFIGSYVCRQLLEEGNDVVVYDAFVHYIPPMQSLLKDYLELRFAGIEDQIDFRRGDTRDKAHLRRVIREVKPDRILHLAALPIADLSNTHSEEALTSILEGAVNVLEVLRDVDFVDRFLYISSSMIYGDFEEIPAPEDHPKRPKDIYGGTKYAGEVMTETFGRRYAIPYSIVRPSAVYGPYDVNRRVSQIFVENALLGKPITLYSGGHQSLDFTYVEDTASGIIKVLFHEDAEGEAFNITYGRGYTLREFAKILKGFFPDLEVNIVQERDVFRPKRGALSIEKAKQMVGYKPQVSLQEGLGRYLDVYKKLEVFNNND
ncbi:MAG: NAD-dependent epimerase/dehydratase family protein [Anaerolineales bacterium]